MTGIWVSGVEGRLAMKVFQKRPRKLLSIRLKTKGEICTYRPKSLAGTEYWKCGVWG